LGGGTHNSVTDAQGIALAAIQGLKAEKDRDTRRLHVQQSVLRQRLEAKEAELSEVRVVQEIQAARIIDRDTELATVKEEVRVLKQLVRKLVSSRQLASVEQP